MKRESKPPQIGDTVHVYIARIPFPVEDADIFPATRKEEIESCSNPDVRRDKFFVWKLLERALMRSLGLDLKELDVSRTESGKWECSACCFSLSHSGNLVAVALSEKPIGVDIEKMDEARFTDALAEKITTAREREMLGSAEGGRGAALNALWTKKEAVFKLLGKKAFQPWKIETSEYATVTKAIRSENEGYVITVASNDDCRADFRESEGMTLSEF